MPELPEVETSRRLLVEHCRGATIESVTAADDTIVIVECTPKELENNMRGSTIVELHRRGKHLWWELDEGKQACLFHLGMTGAFVVRGKAASKYKSFSVDAEVWPPRFHKLLVTLSTGVEIAFVDSRRFGRIRMAADPLSVSPICDLGPDFILAPPSAEEWAKTVGKRTGAIKGVLLDQSVACGVGNWVADEVLFQARIHPETAASALSSGELEALRQAVVDVCALAVSVGADDKQFPPDWLFHSRWHKAGGVVLGHPVSYITVNGRTSAFVPALQKKKAGSGAGASGSRGKKRGPPETAPGEDEDGDAVAAEEDAGAGERKPKGKGRKPAASKAASVVAGPKRGRRTKADAGASGDAEEAQEAPPEGAAAPEAAEAGKGEGKGKRVTAGAGKRGRGGGKSGGSAAAADVPTTSAAAAADAGAAVEAAASPKKKARAGAAASSAAAKRKAADAPAPLAAVAVAAALATLPLRRSTRGGA